MRSLTTRCKACYISKCSKGFTVPHCFARFVSSVLFYGLSLNVGTLFGDIFVNNAVNAAVEIFVSLAVLCVFVVGYVSKSNTTFSLMYPMSKVTVER